jgi:hypothetical protein
VEEAVPRLAPCLNDLRIRTPDLGDLGSAQLPKGGITIAFNACLDGTPLAKCLRQALPARSRRRILARYGLD